MLNEEQLSRPIPTLSDRQFVVTKTSLSEAEVRTQRELFWYREELFKSVRGHWQEVSLSATSYELLFDVLTDGRSKNGGAFSSGSAIDSTNAQGASLGNGRSDNGVSDVRRRRLCASAEWHKILSEIKRIHSSLHTYYEFVRWDESFTSGIFRLLNRSWFTFQIRRWSSRWILK